MLEFLDIRQDTMNGSFHLHNWPREIELTYEQVSWIYDGSFHDIEEFDINRAKKYYKINS